MKSYQLIIVPESPLITLVAPVWALVVWPDGRVGVVWELPAGTTACADEVVQTDSGFLAWVRPLDAPEVFALVKIGDPEIVGEPVPF